MARPGSDAPQRALDAALAIVCRDGAAALTIDAVAKEAGLSKGGVLHHYATKDQLIHELVLSMTKQWEAAVEAEAETDAEPVGRYVRAFLRALSDPGLAIVGRGLLGAVALNPALLDPLRESYSRCQKRIARDGLDPVVAYQCVLVADGLWYGAIFELPPPPKKVLNELQKRLVASTRRSGTN